jgi:hypothetical protein
MEDVYTNRLQSIECGRISREGERGWTGHLTVDEDEPVEVVVYCLECNTREFGDAASMRIPPPPEPASSR